MKRLTPCCLAASIKFFCPSTVTSLLPTADTITSTSVQAPEGFHPSLSRLQRSLRSLLDFIYFLALFLMAVVARSHHCFNFNSSFLDRSSDNLRTQHSGRTDNQNGQFCNPDFPCKVYRLITKASCLDRQLSSSGELKVQGWGGSWLKFSKVVGDARVLTH